MVHDSKFKFIFLFSKSYFFHHLLLHEKNELSIDRGFVNRNLFLFKALYDSSLFITKFVNDDNNTAHIVILTQPSCVCQKQFIHKEIIFIAKIYFPVPPSEKKLEQRPIFLSS